MFKHLIESNSVQTLGEGRTLGLHLGRGWTLYIGHFVQDEKQVDFPKK